MKRLKLEQQTVERPQVKMVKKSHREKKTVYKQEKRNITNIVWQKKMMPSSKIMIYTRQRNIQVRKFKKVKQMMTVAEFRNKTV